MEQAVSKMVALTRKDYVSPLLIVSLLLLSVFAPAVRASSTATPYSMNVVAGRVSVHISLSMFQNLTVLERGFRLPEFHVSGVGTNASGLAELIQDALRARSHAAIVSNLNVDTRSSAWSNATSTQWINESLALDVGGVTMSQGGNAQVDMAWKSFQISPGYLLGGVEVNRIGQSYFDSVAASLAAMSGSSSQFIHLFYQVNGKSYDPNQFQAAVSNMTVLDFSSFSAPVSEWHQPQFSLNSNEIWSLRGAQNLGLVFIEQVQEQSAPANAYYGFFYSLNGTISAPRSTRASGDTLILVTSEFNESLMVGVILSLIALWAGTTLFERRIQGKVLRKKPRR